MFGDGPAVFPSYQLGLSRCKRANPPERVSDRATDHRAEERHAGKERHVRRGQTRGGPLSHARGALSL
eukprot:scaffold22973_cov18-Tisochrysis_lutea.AAC.1